MSIKVFPNNDPVSKEESPAQKDYRTRHQRHHRIVNFFRLLVILLFLTIWELSAHLHLIDPFFFSSPSLVVDYLLKMFQTGSFYTNTSVTLFETIASFLLVTLISIGAAILLWYSKTLSEILEPYLVVLNSLPKSALAPLLIVWLGTGTDTIMIAGISVAIFGAIISLYTSFCSTNAEKLRLIETLGGSRYDALLKVVLPSNIPAILSNMKVNIGLSLVGVIIGEFLSARKGLGYLIIYGTQVFQLNMVITSILILCVIAMLLYQLIQLLEHSYKKRN